MEIEINHLTKTYKNFTALENISTILNNGITGLLGPNGAGKSTLIKTLIGLEKSSGGQIRFLDIQEKSFDVKASLGYVPQSFQLPESLTGEEFLSYMSTAKGIDHRKAKQNNLELLELLNLSAVAKKRIATYSGGMKQRLGIAQALLNRPKLLILDEPTVGLDPDERLNLKHIITNLAQDTIILLSTHIVSDIESVADRLIILNQGEIQVQGNSDELLERMKGNVWEAMIPQDSYEAIQKKYIVSNTLRKQSGIQARLISEKQPENAQLVYPTLEDLYLFHTHQHRLGYEKLVLK